MVGELGMGNEKEGKRNQRPNKKKKREKKKEKKQALLNWSKKGWTKTYAVCTCTWTFRWEFPSAGGRSLERKTMQEEKKKKKTGGARDYEFFDFCCFCCSLNNERDPL
jgi:hypothetical protein